MGDPEPNSTPNSQENGESTSQQSGAPEPSAEKKKLTPEEQMALYEESLKETDWGHQPC